MSKPTTSVNVAISTPSFVAACAKPQTNGHGKTTPSSGLELGDELLGLARREHARRQPALTLQLAALLERLLSLLGASEEEIAALAEPDVDLELAREVLAHPDALLHQADVRLARPLRSDPAAVAPARTAAEVAFVDDDDVGHAEACEVIGDRQAHDACADDDDLGTVLHVTSGTVAKRRSASA